MTVCRQGRMHENRPQHEDEVDMRTGQQQQRLSIGSAQPRKQRGLPAQKGHQQGTTATAAATAGTGTNTPTSTTPAHPSPVRVPFPGVRRGRQRARARGGRGGRGGEGEGQGLHYQEAGVDDAQGELTGSQYCMGRRRIGKGGDGG